ncbi:M23 family metallopeptidase [Nocardia sp. NPDC052566]|uniref:M23 family metallopeptidase n=1 Tax=Nocardia sp. NPDC052566 TaxID=3364330 RepID=UPI0037C50F21
MSRRRAGRSEGGRIPVQQLLNNIQQTDSYSNSAWPEHDVWPEADAVADDFFWESTNWWEPEESDRQPPPEVPTAPARRAKRGGAHRLPAPPAALKGRAAIVAMAAGAAVVATGQMFGNSDVKPAQTADYQAVGQARTIALPDAAPPAQGDDSPQLLDAKGPVDIGQFSDLLHNGAEYAQELAEQEAAKLRPLFTKFASGTFTSGYGARWGTLHPGVDVAAPIGTPIYAVEDGTVIDAGPAAGFGMWVRVRGDDGTVTVYGHINTALVSVGEHVLAGDEIATVGNRGESTGPHCHFEVWLNGTNRIDPIPWLATRGISLGPERD